jgi:hypothetical protein
MYVCLSISISWECQVSWSEVLDSRICCPGGREKAKLCETDSFQDVLYECVGADKAAETALKEDPYSYRKWLQRAVLGFQKIGRDIAVTKKYKDWLTEAGFVDVTETLILTP